MSNLPPGVTESMIPGNRPEDLAYEKFWEEVTEHAQELGLSDTWPDAYPEEDRIIQLIDWVYNKGHKEGYHQALADAALETHYLNEPDEYIEGGDHIAD